MGVHFSLLYTQLLSRLTEKCRKVGAMIGPMPNKPDQFLIKSH